jgi:hypothetical protein
MMDQIQDDSGAKLKINDKGRGGGDAVPPVQIRGTADAVAKVSQL